MTICLLKEGDAYQAWLPGSVAFLHLVHVLFFPRGDDEGSQRRRGGCWNLCL